MHADLNKWARRFWLPIPRGSGNVLPEAQKDKLQWQKLHTLWINYMFSLMYSSNNCSVNIFTSAIKRNKWTHDSYKCLCQFSSTKICLGCGELNMFIMYIMLVNILFYLLVFYISECTYKLWHTLMCDRQMLITYYYLFKSITHVNSRGTQLHGDITWLLWCSHLWLCLQQRHEPQPHNLSEGSGRLALGHSLWFLDPQLSAAVNSQRQACHFIFPFHSSTSAFPAHWRTKALPMHARIQWSLF